MATEDLSDKEKIRVSSDFLLHAPPGEFNEVLNDVRLLLNNDNLLRDGCAGAIAQYNRDQFIPVRIEGVDKESLITPYNDLGQGRYFDPKSGKSFKYDNLRKESSDAQPWQPSQQDEKAELWRKALQQAADVYIDNHYDKTGVCAVFGKMDQTSNFPSLTLCIEAHKFQPRNFWNGRWRSQWAVILGDKQAELKGTVKVQVHYYEDGNVQLVSAKDIVRKIVSSQPESTAKDIIRIIEEEESAYQLAVQENYTAMSDTTFKALRRQLPVTRTKLDWLKIHSYRVAQDMKPQ